MHERVDDLRPEQPELGDGGLDGGDAVGELHLRPRAQPAVPRPRGGLHSLERLSLAHLGQLAQHGARAGRLVEDGGGDDVDLARERVHLACKQRGVRS
jgi:hypothetical protein